MYVTSPELEAMLWSRLCVIAVEDIGLGSPTAPMLAESLFRMHGRYPRPSHDRFLFAAHLVRVLATSPKDRTSDDMANWAKQSVTLGEALPEIPDFALDMHTRRGQEMGRDYRYFIEEASRVAPQIEDREEKYRNWILAALDAGKLS
jgi:replication-associated recombination protein RarA